MWRLLLAGGLFWVLATLLLGVVVLQRGLGAADEGVIAQPHSAQIVVAAISVVVFGLPGVALAVAGWRRRAAARSQ